MREIITSEPAAKTPRSVKAPQILLTLQGIIRTHCGSVLDASGTWRHYRKVRWITDGNRLSLGSIRGRIPKTWRREALAHAQELLAPFSCGDRYLWGNLDYCPPTPYGSYIWHYTCEMVQQISWLHPAFVQGFRYGSGNAKDKNRESPFSDQGRSDAWDCGYILGLAMCYKRGADVMKWIAAYQSSTDHLPAIVDPPRSGAQEG